MSRNDDRGRVRFDDGMRVTREHLEHLQEISLAGDIQLREALGAGRVAHGCRVVAAGPVRVRVEPGFAIDGRLRPLALVESVEVDLPTAGERRVVLAHRLRGDLLFKGTPTRFVDEVVVELREAPPPYEDGGVACAVVAVGDPNASVRLRGEAYLPAPDHGHTGTFRFGPDQRWRYDGVPLGLGAPDFDSGPVRLDPGECRDLDHGLSSREFIVMLEAHLGEVVQNRGLGADYWYELPGDDQVRVCRGEASAAFPGELHVRVRLYAHSDPDSPPQPVSRLPLADAGPDLAVDGSSPFTLDGSGSRAFGDRTLSRYRWTRIS